MKAQQQSPKGHCSLFILSVYTAKRSANYQTNPGLQEQEGERENSLCFKWDEVSGSLVCKIAGN